MPARRPSTTHPDPLGPDAAARRLAQLAAVVTAPGDPPPARTTPADDEAWWSDHTRVAAPLVVAPREPVVPVVLPRPGRHAATRSAGRPRWAELARSRVASLAWLPRMPGLPGLGVAQVAVVALAIATGLALTTWWVVHDRERPLDAAAPITPVAATASGTAPPLVALPSAGSTPVPGQMPPQAARVGSGPAATVTVDVAGRVRHPGIVVLAQGARVTDALAAAGGARRGVDLSPLNLARVLVDGEQVVVGAPPGAAAVPGGDRAAAAGAASAPGPLVDLNTADQGELETLPQIGPVTAQAIMAWRTEHGGFTRVDELLEVDGIGPKTLERLLPHVTV